MNHKGRRGRKEAIQAFALIGFFAVVAVISSTGRMRSAIHLMLLIAPAVAAHRWRGRARLFEEPRPIPQRHPRDRRHIAYPGVGRRSHCTDQRCSQVHQDSQIVLNLA